eukprot:15328138-Ditylum_brightwellii.AAC.1
MCAIGIRGCSFATHKWRSVFPSSGSACSSLGNGRNVNPANDLLLLKLLHAPAIKGSVTLVKESHPENAFSPMCRSVEGKTASFNDVQY